MKKLLYFSFFLLITFVLPFIALGQSSPAKISDPIHIDFATTGEESIIVKKWSLPGFSADRDLYRPARPYMSQPVNTNALLGDSFWVGAVTTQSYNHGKIGRFYYWDIQGNLRGSHLFLDIAGKNKRGLKLVFPRHKAIF